MTPWRPVSVSVLVFAGFLLSSAAVGAQTPPSPAEESAYSGLHGAALTGNAAEIRRLIAQGADIEARDQFRRTPLHVAAYKSHEGAVKANAQ